MRSSNSLAAHVLAAAAVFASACGEKAAPAASDAATQSEVAPTDVTAASDAKVASDGPVDAQVAADVAVSTLKRNPDDCDGLITASCAMPWPSNKYLKPDASRKTGYTLSFGKTSLPAEYVKNHHLTPDDYTLLDGYSIGTGLLMQWPNLDMVGLPNEASISLSLEATAKLVLLEVDAKGAAVRTIAWWAELDSAEENPKLKTLIVRPAMALLPATRYVVGVRNLKDTTGKAIAPSQAFANLVDGKTAGTADAPRQARFDDLLGILGKHGWDKKSLVVAWDFVTNSEDALHGRLLKMREDGYKAVGDLGPEIKIDSVKSFTEAEDKDIAVEMHGQFTVPNWLAPADSDNRMLVLGTDNLPIVQGKVSRPFQVRIPRSALTGEPHGLLQYGHGLNGSYGEVESGYLGVIANKYKYILFACYWTGMSEHDVGSIVASLQDLSVFRVMADKLHQGMIDQTLLQRAMRERFANMPEVKKLGIVVDKKAMFYSGNSQGGIYGGTVMALTKDIERGHLGVPGCNYATLLQRSSDFTEFFGLLSAFYPSSTDQQVLLMTIQLQWDAVDPITWYHHLEKDPLPGNSKHHVLIVPAKGDWQVSVLTNEVAARSGFGIEILKNYGRPVFGVNEHDYPYTGSGIVLFDMGNPWPAAGNMAPFDTLGDPHGKPRKLPSVHEQMVHFFKTGEIKDVCGGNGCTPD